MGERYIRGVFLASVVAAFVVSLTIPASADSHSTGFTKDSYKVYEYQDTALIEVRAQGCCPAAQGQVDYYTSDLTAVAGRDYVHTAGTLILAAGARAWIRVPLVNDELVEDKEQFQVTLTNFRGTFNERGTEKAVVNTLDDDWTYREPEQAADESRPEPPPKPPSVPQRPDSVAPPAPSNTGTEATEVIDDVSAPPLEAAPGVTVREDQKGQSSASGVATGMLLLLAIAAVAFGFRR